MEKQKVRISLFVFLLATVFGGTDLTRTYAAQPLSEKLQLIKVEASIEKRKLYLQGIIINTDIGLALRTSEGKYLLEGLNLEYGLGKEVYVTGVVTSDEGVKTLYVIEATLKT